MNTISQVSCLALLHPCFTASLLPNIRKLYNLFLIGITINPLTLILSRYEIRVSIVLSLILEYSHDGEIDRERRREVRLQLEPDDQEFFLP